MKPAISQVCSLQSPFDKDVEDFAAAHCETVELWLTKLEQFLQQHSTDDAKRLLSDHGINAPVASFQGGLLTSQGEARKQAWDLFDQRLNLCRAMEIEILVVVGDILPPLGQQDLERTKVSLTQAAEAAEKSNVKLAFEFQANAAFANNLQTAAALIGEIGNSYLGICLDLFHYYVGPSKPEDLAYLTTENLFHVQICDLADVPREFAKDSHRILPGDGDIPLSTIVSRLVEIGYEKAISLELMNPQIWQVPTLQVAEIGMTALRKTLGQSSMGN